ncbi:hypothetical protein H311_04909, partial [Anncaliia algerae PRA109]
QRYYKGGMKTRGYDIHLIIFYFPFQIFFFFEKMSHFIALEHLKQIIYANYQKLKNGPGKFTKSFIAYSILVKDIIELFLSISFDREFLGLVFGEREDPFHLVDFVFEKILS